MPDEGKPRRVAILAPMTGELRPVVRALSLKKSHVDGRAVWSATVAGTDVVATLTGVGTANAADAATFVLDRLACDALFVSGVAGGITASLGSVVVPAVVIDAATGAELRPTLVSDTTPELRGTILTTDDFIVDPAALQALADRGITAVDMETAAIARVCDERGVAWAAFRGISDNVFDEAVDEAVLGLTRADGTPDLRAVARFVAARPTRIRLLMRLGRQLRTAAGGAAAAAIAAAGLGP